jgi:ribosomal protein L20
MKAGYYARRDRRNRKRDSVNYGSLVSMQIPV